MNYDERIEGLEQKFRTLEKEREEQDHAKNVEYLKIRSGDIENWNWVEAHQYLQAGWLADEIGAQLRKTKEEVRREYNSKVSELCQDYNRLRENAKFQFFWLWIFFALCIGISVGSLVMRLYVGY